MIENPRTPNTCGCFMIFWGPKSMPLYIWHNFAQIEARCVASSRTYLSSDRLKGEAKTIRNEEKSNTALDAFEVLLSNSPKSSKIYSDFDNQYKSLAVALAIRMVTKTSCSKFLVASCCFNILLPSTILKFFDSKLYDAYPHFAIQNRLSNASFTWFLSCIPYKSFWIFWVKWLWNWLFAIQITGSSMVTFGIRSRCTEGPCGFPVLAGKATSTLIELNELGTVLGSTVLHPKAFSIVNV